MILGGCRCIEGGGAGLYSIGLVAALILMSGLIAIIGDRVGRTVGRRRLSLFGLRPRYTSDIITVVTGVLIAAVSLSLMLAVSGEVRMALFRIDEIQRTLGQNRRELERLQRELATQHQQLEQAVRARDEAVSRSQEAAQQRERAEAQLNEARQLLAQVQKELEAARSQLAQTQARLNQTRADLSFQVSRVNQLKQLGEALASRVEDLRAQVSSLEQTQRQLSEAIITLWNTAQRLQYGSVAYQREEIVLAGVIDARGSRQEAQARLLEFLRAVDAAAAARTHPEGDRPPEGGVVRISPEEFDSAVEVLVSGKGPWVVRARALRNTLVGEAVPVGLELVPRGLAFRKGQVVAEEVVEATGQPVENQVLDLLRTVNERAIRYGGMVSGPDGTVGKLVSADEFSRVVAELRQAKRPVRVVAVAAADTYNTEGPLQIELRVESGPGGQG